MGTTQTTETIIAAMHAFCSANDAKLSALLAGGWERMAYEGQPLWTIADVAIKFPGFGTMVVMGVVMDFGRMPSDLLAVLTASSEAYYDVRSEVALTPASYRVVCERQTAEIARRKAA